jgi:DNA-directed RNA polymerase subunit RPC12/RpoP
MSEFKYACPVCGQHIKCDSSQSGSIMECPTCFQKITAPQAPAEGEQKFIITGKKVGDRPAAPVPSGAEAPPVPPRPGFPLAALALLVLLVAVGVVGFLFRDHLFPAGQPRPVSGPAAAPTNRAPAEPVVLAPHASDTSWLLNLAGANIPDAQSAGRIHGQDFLAEHAVLQNGSLTLREDAKGPVEFGLTINFSGVAADVLAGKTISITTNAPLAARVTLHWKENGQVQKDAFETGYALRIEFGILANNHIAGRLYFCAPDDAKSYVAGNFVAEVRKAKAAKPKPPGAP